MGIPRKHGISHQIRVGFWWNMLPGQSWDLDRWRKVCFVNFLVALQSLFPPRWQLIKTVMLMSRVDLVWTVDVVFFSDVCGCAHCVCVQCLDQKLVVLRWHTRFIKTEIQWWTKRFIGVGIIVVHWTGGTQFCDDKLPGQMPARFLAAHLFFWWSVLLAKLFFLNIGFLKMAP